MSCLGRSPTWHTNTILDVHMEVKLFHLFPHRSPFWAQRSSFSFEEKGFHMQSSARYNSASCSSSPKRDGLSRFSDFLRNSKPKDQRLQVGLFY